MKIKTKLLLSLSFLFIMIVTLSALAIRQVRVLGDETKNILVANYQSLDYSRNMYKILDESNESIDSVKFIGFMKQQLSNVTEIGEQEYTNDLKEDYGLLVKNPKDKAQVAKVRQDLNNIMKLNMDAIKRKSATAEKTADQSALWISIASAFCFIIGFTLIVNLPGYIANPIRTLTESIRQIAAKNYSQRVNVSGHDEFSALARSFNTMAEKLQEYSNSNIAKLMMEKSRIETLINNLNDPVIGLDDRNKILFINERALQISGLANEDLIGKQSEEIALRNDLMRSLLQHLVGDRPAIPENLKIYSDNKESYFEKHIVPISVVPTGETDKKHIGSFIILRNITAYKELDTAKTNFIATVSHEFKTPIASMKMSIQLLENEQTGTLNDEQKNLISGLRDDTDRLLRTTGELLNITQVETGNTAMALEPCNVDTIINAAIEGNKVQAGAKQIVIRSNIPSGLPEILADKEKAIWIVSNLISNAIRYSYENSTIEIHSEIKQGNVLIAVKDHGIGIADNYLSKVFDKYFRVPGTQREGTGLGLAISKEFMEAQGGEISVSSNPGEGSCFTLLFKTIE
ncbi:MAG: HAMP domain-containing protein [Pedobacter sp.]|nr:MAG: HAMP domain-containing protein [Pedobacter sp.]